MDVVWKFEAMDSLFFRDGSPMYAGESAWVDSVFPPSGQTLQGAVRAAVLDYLNADIKQFQKGQPCLLNGESLKAVLGDGASLGSLSFTGPFLYRNGKPLFPAPLDLVRNREGRYGLLKPSQTAVASDFGNVRMPQAAETGVKTLEGHYVTLQAMEQLLHGDTDSIGKSDCMLRLFPELKDETALADREPKVGLARDNALRKSREGMLYAIAPVRPRNNICLAVVVSGLEPKHCPPSDFIQKLGGEGKMARITLCPDLPLPAPTVAEKDGSLYFRLVLMSPGLFPKTGWLPDGFEKTKKGPCDIWTGAINNLPFDIISGCVGKPQRIGGWNLAKHRSEPLRAFAPAGTVWFCRADPKRKSQILSLHGAKTGGRTEYGFGHMLVGRW